MADKKVILYTGMRPGGTHGVNFYDSVRNIHDETSETIIQVGYPPGVP